jgi:uncharacterized protein involved in type VI secretion and phage assembly
MNNRIGGVVVGRVKSVNDTQGEGRIKIEFPWMEGRNQSYWAPLATLMSGGGRGAWFMPEEGDEVLVAFDQGDVNYPYIIGFLWNGVDKPPRTDPALRTIQTVSGHVLEFDDNGGNEKISLLFKGGDPSITMESSKLSLKFDSTNFIEISSEGVTIKGTTLSINGQSSVSMESTGEVSIQGSMIKLN